MWTFLICTLHIILFRKLITIQANFNELIKSCCAQKKQMLAQEILGNLFSKEPKLNMWFIVWLFILVCLPCLPCLRHNNFHLKRFINSFLTLVQSFFKKSQFRENILIIAPFNKIPCRNQTLESDAFQLSLGYEFETIRIPSIKRKIE